MVVCRARDNQKIQKSFYNQVYPCRTIGVVHASVPFHETLSRHAQRGAIATAETLFFDPADVSVSAMQPCSASFNSLPLPREYNITNMTAAKRYESVWNAFLNELSHNPTATLTSFLKRCNVRQGRMKRWMENNGLSVKEAKKRLRDCQHDGIGDPMSPLSEDSGSLFLPMATDKPAPRSESCDILSGVSLTFPDGTQVNIKRGSAQAVMSFLKLYQREDLPCLD